MAYSVSSLVRCRVRRAAFNDPQFRGQSFTRLMWPGPFISLWPEWVWDDGPGSHQRLPASHQPCLPPAYTLHIKTQHRCRFIATLHGCPLHSWPMRGGRSANAIRPCNKAACKQSLAETMHGPVKPPTISPTRAGKWNS